MNTITLTLKEAKSFLIRYQGLDKKDRSDKKIAIMNIFHRSGCIQYDPLNVVGRNPDLVLQSRIHNYSKKDLNKLLYTDRILIDAWDKMMAIYPITDWPYFTRVRACHGQGTINTLKYRDSLEALDLADTIKAYIIENGPLQSSKLKSPSAPKSIWGHRKLSSAALDYLFSCGELGIYDKSNTQKVYDLIENLVPLQLLEAEEPFSSIEDYIDWYVLRRINAIGLLWNKSGGAWLGYFTQKKAIRSESIKRLLANNLIHPITIESISEEFYISHKNLHLVESIKEDRSHIAKQVRFLAPLDNFLWDRDLIESIFKFTYRWEVYTPVVKREFGYYVLPILYGNDIVGRIEFDYYRGEDEVKILNKWFEPNFKVTKAFEKAFIREIKEFTRYLKNSI